MSQVASVSNFGEIGIRLVIRLYPEMKAGHQESQQKSRTKRGVPCGEQTTTYIAPAGPSQKTVRQRP